MTEQNGSKITREELFYFIDNSRSVIELIRKLEKRDENTVLVNNRGEKITLNDVMNGLKKINNREQKYQIENKVSEDLRILKDTLRFFGKRRINQRSIRSEILNKMNEDWELIKIDNEDILFE